MATMIEWTEKTWNPVTGCTKISEACKNCYAEVMAKRLSGMPASKEKYKNGFKVTLHPDCLEEPFGWKKPTMVFVCSMGDLFHEEVPFSYIDEVLEIIYENPKHTFQLLTKRADRMFGYFENNRLPKNVWLGTTCENSNHYDRIAYLRAIPNASVKFLSCEPLLGNMNDIDLDGIDWLIMGGESGQRARRTLPEWFATLRDACLRQNTALFFKQWGTWGADGIKRSKIENGCALDGREWKQYPEIPLTPQTMK